MELVGRRNVLDLKPLGLGEAIFVWDLKGRNTRTSSLVFAWRETTGSGRGAGQSSLSTER